MTMALCKGLQTVILHHFKLPINDLKSVTSLQRLLQSYKNAAEYCWLRT